MTMHEISTPAALSTQEDVEVSRRTYCLITTTCYTTTSSTSKNNNNSSTIIHDDDDVVRLQCAVTLCQLATQYKVHIFLVDDSHDETVMEWIASQAKNNNIMHPFEEKTNNDKEDFHDNDDTSDDKNYVHCARQDKAIYIGKGGALRQAIDMAITWLNNTKEEKEEDLDVNESVIIFTEPEKYNIVKHLSSIVQPLFAGNAHVVVPARQEDYFRNTYPREQYHSESFGNLYFNTLASQFVGFRETSSTTTKTTSRTAAMSTTKEEECTSSIPTFDWLFGPFAFQIYLANSWLHYEGTSWDAQMIPYIRGVRECGWRIQSVTIDYEHPREMKLQEEGDPVWIAKRLHQLNLLFELLGKKELMP